MRHTLLILLALLSVSTIKAETDEGRVSINIVQPEDNGFTEEANNYLATKMQQMVTANGMADNGLNERFVLTAKINVLQKDIVPSTPARVSEKLEITFLVGDIEENKLYETVALEVSGIGTNETKAAMAAFQQVKTANPKITAFLANAKEKIASFYADNCESIIKRAQTLAATQEYDEAIYMLMSVPNVCGECYESCLSAVAPIYQSKIDNQAQLTINKAKALWTADRSETGAAQALQLVAVISPQSSLYPQVEALYKEISKKLSDDEKREWQMQVRQYEDSQKLKQSLVKACRDIGVAWGQNQPKPIYKNIIRWW